jgi:hypothetical protein
LEKKEAKKLLGLGACWFREPAATGPAPPSCPLSISPKKNPAPEKTLDPDPISN